MKQAVIVTENQYPCEDAGAIRQHVTAKLIEKLGYSVFVLGYGKSTNKKILNYDGIDYISFRPISKNKFVRAIFRATVSRRMVKFVKHKFNNPSLVLVADVSEKTFELVSKVFKKSIIIHDSVEWFSEEQFDNAKKARAYKMRDNINRNLVSKGWRVMAISSYLEEHFSKQCDKVVRIPVIMDVDSMKYRVDIDGNCGKIKIAYVGSPGKKDYLKNIVEGFELLSKELLERVEFHIVGVSNEQLVSMCDVNQSSIENLGDVLFVHGRIPHQDAIGFVQNSDFTVLLRDASLRYARAGFPTKSVESLASATPIICNLSSDLGLYLKDGKNAFVAEDHMPESLKVALEKAITSSCESRREMRTNARKTAEEDFDYKNYTALFEELLKTTSQ